ncbi:hypothetical protein ABZO31_03130 [Streptomyces sp. HUAS MG47]|uniref:hypothetical protein n=1 Tax=Streptomyces solicamelliae TaxID=3231716 RepID=UPI003877B38C
MVPTLEQLVVRHTLRLPVPSGSTTTPGQGAAAARQFDAALMTAGFKLSSALFARLAGLPRETVTGTAAETLDTLRRRVGDHVRHNVYFRDFPANVPDTHDFWAWCVSEALADDSSRASTLAQLSSGMVDLLTLPSYGTYLHTYEEMLTAQDELIAAAGDRLTVLHLGGEPAEEVSELYLALAGSTTPLGEEALADLAVLAAECVGGPQPGEFPVRENRAVVNAARLRAGASPLLDTVTDVLRLACALADGDVTLREPTRFRALSRPVRRTLLAGLDAVVAASPAKLADVAAHREAWKRLGERLHPHEYPKWPHAAEVFAVARGEKVARSFDSRLEELLDHGDVLGATALLKSAPGRLFRSLDRLLRADWEETPVRQREVRGAVVAAATAVAPAVSGRVLLSVREHLDNRRRGAFGAPRLFVNGSGSAWVTPDTRAGLPASHAERLIESIDAELSRRLPLAENLLVDPEVLDVALPLSGKAVASGVGVLPRGSVTAIEGELLRFFVYWKQTAQSTDYDLSALMLKADYSTQSWLSYTALTGVEGEHSGDITDAPDGASEFINLRLGAVRGRYIVPQVNLFSGEGFEETEESFFGFMLRESEQQGRPFEPRTVRMKSDLRGPGRVALPLVFLRDEDDGRWYAKWMHFHLRGRPASNRVEENRVSVSTLVRGVVERRYLTIRYLVGLLTVAGGNVTLWDGKTLPEEPVTYIGLERPDGLPAGSRVLTPGNLRDIVPA